MSRKLIGLFLVLFMFASSVSAAVTEADVTSKAFKPTLSTDINSLEYRMFRNPAKLAENKLTIQGLSVSASGFNLAKAMEDQTVSNAVEDLLEFRFTESNMATVLTGMLENIGKGYNDVAAADVGLGVAVGRVGVSLDARADAKTMPSSDSSVQSLTNTAFVPVVDAALSVGFGTKLWQSDSAFVEAGAAVRYAVKGYLKALTAGDVLDNADFEEKETSAGYAIPVDLGVVYGIADGKLQFDAAVTNLNGYYYMKDYASYSDALKSRNGTNSRTEYSPWELGVGVQFSPGWKVVDPTFTFRIDNINGYFRDDANTDNGRQPVREFVRYITVRADFTLFRVIDMNVAFTNGYPELGAAVDLWGNALEFRYGFHEAGTLYGSKPVDTFTFRVKLGFDSNR